MNKFVGKVAVVTGGSSGIGLATAKRLVEGGRRPSGRWRHDRDLRLAVAALPRVQAD